MNPFPVNTDSPSGLQIRLFPVGVIHSPYHKRGDAPHQERERAVESTVEIFQEYAPALGTMNGITHIWVLYWMDRAERNLLVARRKDRMEESAVFSIRSPARPNPIALSIGEIKRLDGRFLEVTGIEAIDSSPVIDIKPYIREIDCVDTG